MAELWVLLWHCQIAKEREVMPGFVKASSLGSQKYNLHYNETEIMKAGGRCVIQRACCQRQWQKRKSVFLQLLRYVLFRQLVNLSFFIFLKEGG